MTIDNASAAQTEQGYNPSSTDPLITKATAHVEELMSHYDASHDFHHIQRVVGLALHIASATNKTARQQQQLDMRLVHLAALLHDVGDRKYAEPDDPTPPHDAVRALLADRLGAEGELAAAVQRICTAVSWTKEKSDPALVRETLSLHPELGPVQDADRLDAIGAVGVGRLFTYGGARTERSMAGSMAHLDDKLLLIMGRLKTEEGRRLGRERTERLRAFKGWFWEEVEFAVGGGGEKGVGVVKPIVDRGPVASKQ